MKTITTEVFELDELSDKAKERARSWFRECTAGDTWWAESITDELKNEIGPMLGFLIENTYWSGFASQGDGACFTGTWLAANVDAAQLKQFAPKDATLHRIADGLALCAKECPDGWLRISHSGHYYHDGYADFEDEGFTLGAIRSEAISLARDLMRWLYQTLENEYDGYNSDECVDENIRCNEYTFTANGRRFG